MQPLSTAQADFPLPQDRLDTIETLYNRTVDALAGYEKMVEKAEPSFRPTAQAFRALHAGHADRLSRLLSDLGRDVSEDGTLMGTINVAVVSMRSMFDAIDHDVMENIRSGEDSILGAFDNAIAKCDDATLAAELSDMRLALTSLLDRTSHIA